MPASVDIKAEWELIRSVAELHGVDPLFIAAIRSAEAGGEGREFGVLDGTSKSYGDQLMTCVKTIRRYLDEYEKNPLGIRTDCGNPPIKRVCYNAAFIAEAANRYCPVGAENDPTGLNQNWFANVLQFYGRFLKANPGALWSD